METKRVTASEREAMMRIFVAAEMLMDEAKRLERRTAMIPHGRLMVSGAAGLARKLIAEYLATVPDEQLISISRMMKSISYTVGMKKPGSGHSHNDEYGMWISFNLANQLFSGCHDHCMMCAFDGVKQRTCPLRKALAEIAIETVDEGGDCPYFGVM